MNTLVLGTFCGRFFQEILMSVFSISSWPNQRPTWTMYCTVGGRKPRSLTSKERPRKSQKRLNTLSESIWYVANTTLHNDDFLFIFFSFENEMQQKLMEKLYISVLFLVVGCSQDKRRRVWRFAKSLSTFRSGSGRDSQLQRVRKTS